MDAFGALSEPLRAPSFKTLASSSLPLSILTPNVTPTRLQWPCKCSTLWIKYIYLFAGIIYSCEFDRKITSHCMIVVFHIETFELVFRIIFEFFVHILA